MDEAERSEVFARHWPSLAAFAGSVVGDRHLGEELAQIALTERLTTAADVRDEGAWLRTVVMRRARNHWRRTSRERRALQRLGPPDPQAAPDTAEPIGYLTEAITRLPGRQRAAVLLVYGEDRSTAEAASVLGCSEATLRVHLHRARNALRISMGERIEEELER